MNQKPIAFLGLGLMGGYMAANLAKAGFPVKAWNRTPTRPGVKIAADGGAIITETIAAATAHADFIFTCVGDVPDVEEVLLGSDGAIHYAPKNAVIVDMSTIGPEAARAIAKSLQNQGLRFLDAPVSGGDIGAKNGTLTIMAGGETADFQACQPYFEAMGQNIHLCGSVGSGQGVKMCNQVLCSLHMVGLCEALLLAQKQGIDPNLIVEVCGSGAAGSWALANLGPKIAENDYNPGFAIKHILKDLRLVLASAQASQQKLPGVDLATALFEKAGDLDDGMGREQGTQGMMRGYGED
ncbi:MAG: NAD(P)-dependent oxidoreductase [Jaaginema sp. PMC 1079.18]|nr:NAD(P)-dependent oxidoreductase [Jaaginema sp. PMC 1080.18]MEC4853969.1 NAD(P)-dependent oxidoreductase [Jaaginema sp. PMC 1079.18]MEC4867006.1 NAD(P)-dependent oxidoreductase [Jaaginema sp. PMC 1078.18]